MEVLDPPAGGFLPDRLDQQWWAGSEAAQSDTISLSPGSSPGRVSASSSLHALDGVRCAHLAKFDHLTKLAANVPNWGKLAKAQLLVCISTCAVHCSSSCARKNSRDRWHSGPEHASHSCRNSQ